MQVHPRALIFATYIRFIGFMYTRSVLIFSCASAVLSLSACSSGDDNNSGDLPPGFLALAGGNTTVQTSNPPSCVSCSITNTNAAIDGDFGSSAKMIIPQTSTGTQSIRATAQAGITYPVGSEIAVKWNIPSGQGITSATLRTYRNGAPTGDVYAIRTNSNTRRPAGFTTAGSTLAQFNAVEFSISKNSADGPSNVGVFGFAVK